MFQRKSEKGQAIILIVFAIVGLIGMTGLTVDGGLAYSDRRHAQNTVDSAAWAAGLARARSRDVEAAAYGIASQNGYTNDGQHSVVTVTVTDTPNGVCPGTGKDITVQIVSNVDTLFAPVIGVRTVTNIVSATSRACDVKTVNNNGEPYYPGFSVMATKTAECGNGITDKTLFTNGSSKLQVWGGDLGSSSPDGNCLYFKGGDVQLKKAESGTECSDIVTVAPSSESSQATYKAVKGQDGCGSKIYGQAFPPPPDDLNINCTGNATISGNTMSPGNYSGSGGTMFPNGATILNPGVYCVEGGMKVNANQKLNGAGVTIVLKSGNLHWNGTSEVKLSAPASGDTKGLLIYMPPGNNSDIDINGNSNAKITGTVMAQNSDCFFAGSGQLQKQTLQFICYTWGMDGSGQAEIVYNSSSFFTPPAKVLPPTISLLK